MKDKKLTKENLEKSLNKIFDTQELKVIRPTCTNCGIDYSEHGIINSADEAVDGTLWVCPENL